MAICEKCGRAIESKEGKCRCMRLSYSLKVEPGKFLLTLYPVGMFVEGPLDGERGRRVESQPASGGWARSSSDSGGAFEAELAGPLKLGRRAEAKALDVLAKALRQRGDQVDYLPGADDHRGEDARIAINGRDTIVQVVTLPSDQSVWKELSTTRAAAKQGSAEEAVELVRQVIRKKKDSAKGTLLLLDAAHLGAIITADLPRRYLRRYGNPEREFLLAEVWIVGPSPKSAIRIG